MYMCPVKYSSNSSWQHRYHYIQNTFTESCKTKEPNSIRVLDVGCGTGGSSKHFLLKEHPSVKEVVGVDISKDMIGHAQLYNADDKIKYAVADIQDAMTFDPSLFGSFDVVHSVHAMHWVPQQKRALEIIRSLLVDGGEIHLKFAIVISEIYLEAGVRLLKKSYIPKNYEIPFPFNRRWNTSPWVSVAEPSRCYAEYLSNLQFDVKSCVAWTDHGKAFDRETFISTFKGFYPPLIFIPEEQHNEFIEDMHQIITDIGGLEELEATAGHIGLSVHATKVD